MSALTAPVDVDHRGADETTPAPTARAAALLAVLIVLVGIVIGPMSGFDTVFGVRSTTVAAGQVEVATDEGWVLAEPGDRIADGARVRAASPRPALARGAMTLHLGPDAVVEEARKLGGVEKVDGGAHALRIEGVAVQVPRRLLRQVNLPPEGRGILVRR